MERITKQQWISIQLITVLLLFISLTGCRKEAIVAKTSDNVNITSYLDKYPEQFSEFRKILEITNTAGFLQAYGNYTMFLPTNEGVKVYLKDLGKNSVEEVDIDDLINVVKFHLLEDTIASTSFSDGKLSAVTMYGQYLITGVLNVGGQSTVTVNRQANIEQANVRVGNGYIHVIDNVLRPQKFTLGKLLESMPDKYSIFTDALKQTGLFDSLNILPSANTDPTRKYLTVLAETNEVLSAAGFNKWEDLRDTYNSGNSDLKNAGNGFHAYMAYHILNDAKYLADLASNSPIAHKTLANPEIITSELKGTDIILNELIFNFQFEPGVRLVRESSDLSAFNGVIHTTGSYNYTKTYKDAEDRSVTVSGTTTGQFAIKPRVPFPVYWDVADFPEIRKLTTSFRTVGGPAVSFDKATTTSPSPIADWDWGKQRFGVVYRNDSKFVYRDYLNLTLGVSTRNDWMDFKTPLIVRGRYNIWICYERRRQSSTEWPNNVGTTMRVSIDGGELTTIPLHFAEPAPAGSTAELEALGWKYYTSTGNAANPFTKQPQSGSLGNLLLSKKIGALDIKTTGTHIIRLHAVLGSQNTNNLDMIHFIPVDWPSQVLPRFKVDGSADYTPYPGTH